MKLEMFIYVYIYKNKLKQNNSRDPGTNYSLPFREGGKGGLLDPPIDILD